MNYKMISFFSSKASCGKSTFSHSILLDLINIDNNWKYTTIDPTNSEMVKETLKNNYVKPSKEVLNHNIIVDLVGEVNINSVPYLKKSDLIVFFTKPNEWYKSSFNKTYNDLKKLNSRIIVVLNMVQGIPNNDNKKFVYYYNNLVKNGVKPAHIFPVRFSNPLEEAMTVYNNESILNLYKTKPYYHTLKGLREDYFKLFFAICKLNGIELK